MKKRLYFVMLLAGAAIGSAVTWNYVKKKYEKIAQEEIDSVKEVFAKKEAAKTGEEMVAGLRDGTRMAADRAKDKPDVMEYAAILHKSGYTNGDGEERKDDVMGCGATGYRHPYVIPPEEFGEIEDYEKISLTYYADGVLADDNDEPMGDVENLVGNALEHFGEYEDDSVFARCDERKCDYEILLDQRTFSEVTGNKPGRVEVR